MRNRYPNVVRKSLAGLLSLALAASSVPASAIAAELVENGAAAEVTLVAEPAAEEADAEPAAEGPKAAVTSAASEQTVEDAADESGEQTVSEQETSSAKSEDAAEKVDLLAASGLEGATSVAAPASSAQLSDGTYSVTANLCVPGSLDPAVPGLTAYLTNAANPYGVGGTETGAPGSPVYSNATLTVKGGVATLSLKLANPAFTLQGIGGSSNASVVSSDWDGVVYTAPDGSASRTGRIVSLEVELGDWSGTYGFSGCTEFVSALAQEWGVDLTLSVDLASAVKLSGDEAQGSQDASDADDAPAASGSVSGGEPAVEETSDDDVLADDSDEDQPAADDSATVDAPLTFKQILFQSLDAVAQSDEGTTGSKLAVSELPSGSQAKTVAIDVPAAATGLTYTGSEQVGVAEGEGYTLSGTAKATKAGEYTATATLKSGYTWKDGSTAAKTIKWSIAEAKSELAAGTYTVTANLYLPGELNTQLPGVTAYMTNPNNPNGTRPNNYSGTVEATAPVTPASQNATMVVAANGTRYIIVDVVNPVFTLQSISGTDSVSILASQRDNEVYSSTYGAASRTGRITKLWLELKNDSGTYSFTNCVEFPTLLGYDWKVPLKLSVDFGTAAYKSKSTDLKLPGGSGTGDNTGSNTNGGNGNNGGSSTADAGNNGSGNNNGSNTDNGGSSADTGNASNEDKAIPTTNDAQQNTATATSDHIAAGTYTVSGNIWLPKSETGLPLNPHLSNSGFPPSEPVSSNATMTVDASGHAYVTIPIVIQDKVMVVNSISGSGVSYNGSSVTIDLGTPSAGQSSFSGSCTVSVTIGWLAQTIASGIFNGVWDHTWTAGWEVDLGGGLPSSGGGELPESAQAILNGENGTTDETSAATAALAALKTKDESSNDENNGEDGASDGASEGGVAASVAGAVSKGLSGAKKAVEQAVESNAGLVVGASVAAGALLAGVIAALAVRKKKVAVAEAIVDDAKEE